MPEKEASRRTKKNLPVCPFCGGRHIAAYLRGMPAYSEELMKAIDDGEIILGGCCISGNDPRWHCHDCKKDFGRPPVFFRNKGPQKPEDIVGVDFGVGGFFDGYHTVRIRSSGDEHAICISTPYLSFEWQNLYIREFTQKEWNALKKLLFDRCFIHEWKKLYNNRCVLDGTQWEVILTFRNGKKHEIEGSNDYPGTWDKLDRYMKKYVKEFYTVKCQLADKLRYAYLFRQDPEIYLSFLEYIKTLSDSPDQDPLKNSFAVCFVAFQEDGREYTYLDRKREFHKGDLVRVPVGNRGDETIGKVTAVGEFTRDNMPYPFEKMKPVIELAGREDHDLSL